MKPARLTPGARIGVVAPAGCVEAGALQNGIEAIRRRGFEVELASSILEQKGYLAGDEQKRAHDVIRFLERSDIHGILCARGGFGSVQLLPYLSRAGIEMAPKIFAGYSDITILLNWLNQKLRWVTFHAPMVAMELAQGLNGRSEESFWGVLTGQKTHWQVDLGDVIHTGTVEGELMGGCLSVLITTLGTPYEIDTRGKLLFLEDVGERPYRIERMLTHLKMAGKLDQLAGLIFGDFTDCEGKGPRNVRCIVGEMFEQAHYPVVMGMAAGHGREHITLPFGVKARLDGESASLMLLESPVI